MDDSFYDILALHYDDLQINGDTSAWGPYIYGLISDYCSIKDPSVTDLGCGTGAVTNYLASKGMKVTGVDLSPDMLALASAGDESGTVSWICADITSYEGPSCGCFISTMDTVGHITDPDDLSAGGLRAAGAGAHEAVGAAAEDKRVPLFGQQTAKLPRRVKISLGQLLPGCAIDADLHKTWPPQSCVFSILTQSGRGGKPCFRERKGVTKHS